MKWGVRNERRKAAKAEKKATKADAKWQKNIYSMNGAIDIHNHVAHTMNNGELDALNNTPRFKKAFDEAGRGGKPVFDSNFNPVGKVGQDYMNDYHNRVEKATVKAVREVHGTSPSGKYKAEYKNDRAGGGQRVEVSPVSEAKHSVDGADDLKPSSQTLSKKPTLKISIDRDSDTGCIGTHAKIKTDDMEQSDPVGDFLAHWGVKGMKWGVRNAKKDDKSSKSVPSGPGRSPAHLLSDEQLQKHIARMELEQKYKKLAAPEKKNSATADFLKKHANQAAGAAISMATTVALQQAFKKVVK